MFEEHYGLRLDPFGLIADPRFFHASGTHARALAFFEFGLQQGMGFVVLTGGVGVGKSTVVTHLLETMAEDELEVAYMTSSNLESVEALRHILTHFAGDQHTGEGKAMLLERFRQLLDSLVRARTRALLIVDEAQNMPDETLEELRMLTNMRIGEVFPFQCFLVGQPQFRERISRPEMEQLRQRVIASYHVDPLAVSEVRGYVEHRLTVAGWIDRPSFDPAVFERIHAATEGVPRRINMLCSRLLLFGALEERDHIDCAILETVVEDLQTEVVGIEGSPPVPTAVAPTPFAADDARRIMALEARVEQLETLLLETVRLATRLVEEPSRQDEAPSDAS